MCSQDSKSYATCCQADNEGDKLSGLSLSDIHEAASKRVHPQAWNYINTGSYDHTTLHRNTEAFKKILLLPSYLKDIRNRDLSTSILGHKIDFPVCISPTGFHGMFTTDAEIATAKAAETSGVCYIQSFFSNCSLEQVSSAVPGCYRWAHFLSYHPKKDLEEMISKAKANGYKAIVLGIDTPVKIGKRYAMQKDGEEFRRYFSTFLADGTRKIPLRSYCHMVPKSEENTELANDSQESFTWEDLRSFTASSPLPIILKGVLNPRDAVLAVENGAAGIIVSNHGGRALDHLPATIEMLPHIVEAVRGRVEVYVDGGIRSGIDVLKALALGARAVFLGRPILWGLAYDGSQGAHAVLNILRRELDSAMALMGCRVIADVSQSLIVPKSYMLY